MTGKDTVRRNTKEDGQKQLMTALVFYRWLFIGFAVLFTVTSASSKAMTYAVMETIALLVIYNLIVTAGMLKSKKTVVKMPRFVVYVDLAFISVFSFLSGGIKSDVYILFFFAIFCCGVLCDSTDTMKVGLFSVVFYTVSSLYAGNLNAEQPDFASLAAKDALIMFGAYGISQVRNQVKKYDELRKKEFKLARTDRLTGLANRHYFDQKLLEEAKYADQTNGRLNVLIFDLDNFKRFNDTYGHIAGDKLLALFADIIKQNIRDTDIPVRYGGEEFLLLIRDLDVVIAKSVGDRIRWQLEKQKIILNDSNEKRMVTVSCGLAQYPCDSKNVKEAVELADRALYHAKEHGKNSVYAYNEICSRGA
jgi:diguanylate cyclase (GGDEF)-like protein